MSLFHSHTRGINDGELLKEIEQSIDTYRYFDPIADPPTQEIQNIAIGDSHSLRYLTSKQSDWPLEHMNAAICTYIRARRPIPRYIVLPEIAYRRHLQDILTPKPFNGLFHFQISGMDRPFCVLIYRDADLKIVLPVDTILCLN